MKKNKKLFLVVICMLPQLLFSICSFGQSTTVTGTVTDGTNPLVGVNVLIQGSTTGTVTDANGAYQISASPEATLSFSFIGYLTENVVVGNQTEINVTLVADVTAMEEIVVIGYGSLKKSDITGAVASVNTEQMLKKNPTNILQGLKGTVAGVVVTAQDGAPDANSAVSIRGIATINGTSKPLYVVDGVQIGDDANFLNPNDIESIEVLKDASATAIYGSRGANGVIMITTKRGKVGTSKISFSADYGVQTLASKLDVGDADQYAANLRNAKINDGNPSFSDASMIFTSQYDGQRKTIDWQDELTRVALRQQYYLTASGGSENTQQTVSLGYLNHDGLIVNTNMNRLSGRASVTTKAANFIEVGGDINFIHTESQGSNAIFGNNGNLSSLRDMAFFCPTMDYIDGSGNLISPNAENSNGTYGSPVQGPTGTYEALISDNILARQNEQNGLSKNNKVLLSSYADIKILKGLTFKTIASYNFSANNFDNFYGKEKRYMPDGITEVERYNVDDRYTFSIRNEHRNELAIENFLTYNWNTDFHNLTAMAGNSVSRSFGDFSYAEAKDFPGENIRDINLTSDPSTKVTDGEYFLETRRLSYFGRVTYSLKDRYILTATVRRDGSSNFGIENVWGTFPSVAAAWRISEEDFLKNNPTISNLKLRLGWGQTGNAGNIGNKATTALTSNTIAYLFYPSGGNAQSGFGSTRVLANGTIGNLVDAGLKWETNEQSNIGIDLGILNNTFNLTFDYFIRQSKDLLLWQNIRPSAGHTRVYTNYGEIENKGFEFSLDFNKRLNNAWTFGATLTGSSVKNEIKKVGVDQFNVNESASGDGSNLGGVGTSANVHWDGHSIMREGYAVGSYYGYVVEKVFEDNAEVAQANADAVLAGHEFYQLNQTSEGDFKYKDLNGDGYITDEDRTILGNGFPKLNLGLSLTASYKNLDILIYSYGVFGYEINSYSAMTLSNMFGSDNGTVPNLLTSASEEAWSPTNREASLSKLSILDYGQNMRASDAWVKKGDYFKIGTIQLGYTLDNKILAPLPLSARINFSIQNVLTISSYKKYGDPENGQGSVLYTGLDTGRYPMPRTYSAGITIQF